MYKSEYSLNPKTFKLCSRNKIIASHQVITNFNKNDPILKHFCRLQNHRSILDFEEREIPIEKVKINGSILCLSFANDKSCHLAASAWHYDSKLEALNFKECSE